MTEQLTKTYNINEAINLLREAPSTEHKKQILRYLTPTALEFFSAAYDPNRKYYLTGNTLFKHMCYKPPTHPSVSLDELAPVILSLLPHLESREYTPSVAESYLRPFIATLDQVSFENLINFFDRNLRVSINVKTLLSVYPSLFDVFQVQLAKTIDDENFERFLGKHYLVSPKLDGVRCIYVKSRDALFTRKGKIIQTLPHIHTFASLLAEKLEASILDGEIYEHGRGFSETQGFTSSSFKDPDKLLYNIFAFDRPNLANQAKMYQELVEANMSLELPNINILPQTPVSFSESSVFPLLDRYTGENYEGIMLRLIDSHYIYNRSYSLLKLKKFKESVFTICGRTPGAGKYAHTLGAFTIRGVVDNKVILASVGSGITDDERNIYHALGDNIIGKKIEVKYQDITASSKNNVYSLRFPTVMKVLLNDKE